MDYLVLYLVTRYPELILVFAVIGVLRVINKPVFSFLRTFVISTRTKRDDLVLDSIERSRVYRALSFVLDWLGSIKLPERRPGWRLPPSQRPPV